MNDINKISNIPNTGSTQVNFKGRQKKKKKKKEGKKKFDG